jgi:hypothetical protein
VLTCALPLPLPLRTCALAQSFLNYALLGLVYGGVRLRAARAAGTPLLATAVPWRHYALLAAVDVEANFLIVKAYQFTNITSVTLLDSARRAARACCMCQRACIRIG